MEESGVSQNFLISRCFANFCDDFKYKYRCRRNHTKLVILGVSEESREDVAKRFLWWFFCSEHWGVRWKTARSVRNGRLSLYMCGRLNKSHMKVRKSDLIRFEAVVRLHILIPMLLAFAANWLFGCRFDMKPMPSSGTVLRPGSPGSLDLQSAVQIFSGSWGRRVLRTPPCLSLWKASAPSSFPKLYDWN